jgi:hypothetical protein
VQRKGEGRKSDAQMCAKGTTLAGGSSVLLVTLHTIVQAHSNKLSQVLQLMFVVQERHMAWLCMGLPHRTGLTRWRGWPRGGVWGDGGARQLGSLLWFPCNAKPLPQRINSCRG